MSAGFEFWRVTLIYELAEAPHATRASQQLFEGPTAERDARHQFADLARGTWHKHARRYKLDLEKAAGWTRAGTDRIEPSREWTSVQLVDHWVTDHQAPASADTQLALVPEPA